MRWPRRAGPTSSTSGGPRSTSAGTDVSLDAVVAAARAGDEAAFAALVERHRAELRVHCYRMLGSFDEAEDLVQETFLRAWKNLGGFEGRSTLRAWLYRIATNACLDALDGRARRVLPHHLAGPSAPSGGLPPRTDIAWLQPFPDRLIGADRPGEPAAPSEDEPDAVVVARETIELAFLAAIQHLPPRQRAVLILRDVLGWPAKQTAELLSGSVASVNSALQRARATLRQHLPERRLDWVRSEQPTEQERAVLRRYMDAMERADLAAVADVVAGARCGGCRVSCELGRQLPGLCGPVPDGAHPGQPATGGGDLRSPPRRHRLPRLRDLCVADRGRPHRGSHRLPRHRTVSGVRPAGGAATDGPMSFPAARRLKRGNRELVATEVGHGQDAVLRHH